MTKSSRVKTVRINEAPAAKPECSPTADETAIPPIEVERPVNRAVEPDAQELLEVLRGRLAEGDLDGARAALGARSPDDLVEHLPKDSEERMAAAATVAEILFVFGDDAEARRLLKTYATAPAEMVGSGLDARRKLQLAEYHYSLFDAKKASEIANAILETAKTARDTGECLYYLARFSLRQNLYAKASDYCMRAIEEFLRADPAELGLNSAALSWHMGRILRVRGTALWWLGRLAEATAVLYLAAWQLQQTAGSRTFVGDAFHALGRLLRSIGPDHYQQAIEALDKARNKYEGHDLKLARTLTDLARTRQNMGLHEKNSQEASKQFEASKDHLTAALDLSDKHFPADLMVNDSSTVWLRQKIEVLIWMSWLHQEAEQFVNLDEAEREATEAVNLAAKLPRSPELLEAKLALGQCSLTRRQHDTAKQHLEEARQLADDLQIPKFRVHAYLCLAQYECQVTEDLQKAQSHIATAMSFFTDEKSFGGYLRTKAGRVKAVVDELVRAADHFIFTRADLLQADFPEKWKPLKVLRCRVEKWAIEAAIHREGSLAAGARKLDVSEGTIRDIRARYDDLVNGRPPHNKVADAETAGAV